MALQFQVRINLIIHFLIIDKRNVTLSVVPVVILLLFAFSVAAYGVFSTTSYIRINLFQYL